MIFIDIKKDKKTDEIIHQKIENKSNTKRKRGRPFKNGNSLKPSVLFNFRIPDYKKKALLAICKKNKHSHTIVMRALIDRYMAGTINLTKEEL